MKIPVLVIVGSTASGKTALAVECARKFDGEIVSADSMQIYKGMDIATAKPTVAEMRGIKHHLLDFIDPESRYSVADFVYDAGQCVADIHAREKLPIVAGGTGLYIDSLIDNIRFTEISTDLDLRRRLQKKTDEIGAEAMLAELKGFDPDTALRLTPGDSKRIIRAFEVFLLTGKTMTQMIADSTSDPSPYKPVFVGINFRDRAVLYDRINRRVDSMLQSGLLDEARRYYALSAGTAVQAIGYKELQPYFTGDLPLEACIENLKQSTRNYAKRQLTWFRKNSRINWIYPDDYDSTAALYNAAYTIVQRSAEI